MSICNLCMRTENWMVSIWNKPHIGPFAWTAWSNSWLYWVVLVKLPPYLLWEDLLQWPLDRFCHNSTSAKILNREKKLLDKKTSAAFGQKQKWRSCTGVLDPNDKMFKHVKLWAGVGLLKKSSFWNCWLGWRRLKDKNHLTIWNCRKGGMEPFEIQTGSELCCSVRSSPHPPTPNRQTFRWMHIS